MEPATQLVHSQDLPSVEAQMNYLSATEKKPVNYLYEPPAGIAPRPHTEKHPMRIHDARSIQARLSLDLEGVTLAHHDTAVTNFYDEREVKAVYYPEVERLVREITGAVKVVVFDHNVRNAANDRGDQVRGPVRFVHNDYTLRSGPQRVRDLLPDEAEALLKNRFAVINVWRPIRATVQDSPLAVCDATTMKLADFVPTDLRYRDRTGEVYSVYFNPNHRWYFFPQMRRDEAMLLKCYDSSDDGRARFTAHSAFDDPTAPPDATPRESIEARTLVFFRT